MFLNIYIEKYGGGILHLKGFIKSLKEDKVLSNINNEEDILNIIYKRYNDLGIKENQRDLLIKKYFKERNTNVDTANYKRIKTQNINSAEYKLLMEQRKKHFDKINRVEAEIQKHVTYATMDKKGKNIIFLLDNMNLLNLEQREIQYYIVGYNHLIKMKSEKRKLQKYLQEIKVTNSQVRETNSHYDRMAARSYAHTYCGKKMGVFDSEGYNINDYPVFDTIKYPHNDCANFASQCIFAGGKAMVGSKYGDANAWFCHTKDSSKLSLISYTWRAAGGFKTYWKTRSAYSEVKMKDAYAMKDFINNVYKQLYYGDIIQLADAHGAPWHTLNVTAYSTELYRTDIGYTTHSMNRKDESLFSITNESDDLLLLYHMK